MESFSLIKISGDSPIYRLVKKAFRSVPDAIYIPSEWVSGMEDYLVTYLTSGRLPRRFVLERFRGGLTTAKLMRSFDSETIDAMLEKTKQITEQMMKEAAEDMPPEHLPVLMETYQSAWICEFAKLGSQILYAMLRPRE